MSKFSKIDYVSTARAIDQTWADLANDSRWSHRNVMEIMGAVVTAFADMYEADNPRFDRQRFVEACEGGSQEED